MPRRAATVPRTALVCFAVALGGGPGQAVAADRAPLTSPPPAVVAQTVGGGPVAARGGWSAFSTRRADGRWVLVVHSPSDVATRPVASRGAPFDVRIGGCADGREVAVYSRCARYGARPSGCRLARLDLATGVERPLARARGDASESMPALAGRRLAYVVSRPGAADAVVVRDLGTGRGVRQPTGKLEGGRPTRVVALDIDGVRLASVWTGQAGPFFEYALFGQRVGGAARRLDVTEITGDGCGNTHFTGVALAGTRAYTLNAGGAGWQVERVALGGAKPAYGPFHSYPFTDTDGLVVDAADAGIAITPQGPLVSTSTALWQFRAVAFGSVEHPVYDDSGCA